MGLFKWLLGGAAASKVYNKLNRPIIEFPSTEYTLYALENSGMTGRKWLVRYKYKGSKYTAQIDTGTRVLVFQVVVIKMFIFHDSIFLQQKYN